MEGNIILRDQIKSTEKNSRPRFEVNKNKNRQQPNQKILPPNRTAPTTGSTPILIDPSFTPPLALPPPPTKQTRRKPSVRRRPGLKPPWGVKRPQNKRPQAVRPWPGQVVPQTSVATPPLRNIQRATKSQKPFVFPTK